MKQFIDKVIMEVSGKYYFYDEPELDFDYKGNHAIGIFMSDTEVGYHICNKSVLYDDMKEYIDKVQREENLPDKERFVVCYYVAKDEYDSYVLYQLVDYDITKSEIIANVINQKYIEGADYYLLSDLKEITEP